MALSVDVLDKMIQQGASEANEIHRILDQHRIDPRAISRSMYGHNERLAVLKEVRSELVRAESRRLEGEKDPTDMVGERFPTL